MFQCKQQCINALETYRKNHPFGMLQFAFKFETASSQETILSLGVFRRETASGFYPWGKVDSPRKRVAEDCVVGGIETRFQ